MEPYLLWALETLLLDWETPAVATGFSDMLAASGPAATSLNPPTNSYNASVTQSIATAAQNTGLSANLLRAVATVESDLNPNAISSAGAIGVMQLMPQTAASLGVNPDNVQQNIEGGAEYLQSLLTTFHGNLPLTLAAYNAGPGAVEQYGGIPPFAQTQQYVQKVLAVYQQLNATPPAL